MNQNANRINITKLIFSGLSGSIIEWYDFFLYGVAASLFLNQLYFPTEDKFTSTILAYMTFAIGFVARPLGGLIFGHFGDRIGRKKMLIITLLIMGFATMCVGFIPTYSQIGLWAPTLLVLCRISQGIGLGGEWGGAVLMTVESVPKEKRGFYGSFPQIGMSIGLLLANAVIWTLSYILDEKSFLDWGWRIAFILSFILILISFYIRTNLEESRDFLNVKQSRIHIPIFYVFQKTPKMLLACMGARFMDGVFFNVFAVYSLTFLTTNLNFPKSTALIGIMISAVIMTFMMPFWGWIADNHGKSKIFGLCILLSGLSVYPSFWILNNLTLEQDYIAWIAIAIPFGLFHSGNFGLMSSVFSECFPAEFRYSGISFAYQFTSIFASGLTPSIATWLNEKNDGGPWLLCSYVLSISIISFACTRWINSISKKNGNII